MRESKFAFHRISLAIGAVALSAVAAATVFSQSYSIVPLQSYSQVVGTWEGEVTKASLAGKSITFTFSANGKFLQVVFQKEYRGKAKVRGGKLILFRKGEEYAVFDFHQGEGGQELSGENNNGGSFLISRSVTASAPLPAPASSGPPAGISSASAAGADGFLNEGGIKSLLVGKTIKFEIRGRGLVLYFKDDGRLEGTRAGGGRIFKKDWWVKNGNIFCRKFGKQNKVHCARVKPAGDGKVTFVNPKGKFTYTATLLDGRKLPE